MKLRLIYFSCLTVLLCSNSILAQKKQPDWPKIYGQELFHLTEVMVTDVASPPVAARVYAYASLASYLAVVSAKQEFRFPDFLAHTKLSFDDLPHFEGTSPEFSAIYAMLLVGEKLMPSGYLLQQKQADFLKYGLNNKLITKKDLPQHIDFANLISTAVISSARTDGYLNLPALSRYTPKEGEGFWYPTPPAYMSAIEPEWKTIRTFFMEKPEDFEPAPMAEFDMSAGSPFEIQVREVFQVGNSLSDEQKLIANFWDCNPFKVEFSGHMALGVKKISPGGHWMGITGIAAQKAGLSFSETAYIHALVGMGLHDAFVSCWKAKYETNRIRPETVINQKIDQRWKPLLQTPPFPEYTSGHSVISSTSAVILTSYFGDNFEFLDTSEIYFGLPERKFSSFDSAAREAAISRLYGGIHFRDAIENGLLQGEKIGRMIWEKLSGKNGYASN